MGCEVLGVQGAMYYLGVHVDATWQIRFIDLVCGGCNVPLCTHYCSNLYSILLTDRQRVVMGQNSTLTNHGGGNEIMKCTSVITACMNLKVNCLLSLVLMLLQ